MGYSIIISPEIFAYGFTALLGLFGFLAIKYYSAYNDLLMLLLFLDVKFYLKTKLKELSDDESSPDYHINNDADFDFGLALRASKKRLDKIVIYQRYNLISEENNS